MQLALVNGSKRIASPGAVASCPGCAGAVLAKCGEILVWHWAHVVGEDCDSWAEGETPWHRDWKSAAPLDRQEVIIGAHRADVVAGDGAVCELQHSGIAPEAVAVREAHYGPEMRWLFDARERGFDLAPLDIPAAHRWKAHRGHAWQTIGRCARRVMLDFGPDVGVLSCEKINENGSYAWGYMYPHWQIRAWIAGPDHMPFPGPDAL